MATFRKLASGKWQAGVSTPELLPSGKPKRVYESHQLKSVVQKWATKLEAQIAAGQWHDPHSGDMVLSEWRKEWRANRTAEGATTRKDDSHWRCHIAPKWAGWPLNTITRQELRAWVKEMQQQCPVCWTTPKTRAVNGSAVLVKHVGRTGKPCPGAGRPPGLSAPTLRGAAFSLSAILTGAVNVDPPLLQANPMTGLTLPPADPKPPFWWTRDEAGKIIAQVDGQARLMIDLDIHTGLRIGELLGLKRRYISDGGNGRLLIHVIGVQTRDGWKDHPKSSMSRRPVPVPKHLCAPLLEHIDGLGPDDIVFPAPGGGGGRGAGDGGAWDDRNWSRRVFEPAVEAAGVRRGTPHDMRSTAASWLVQKGIDLYKVQALLGHENYKTTQRYAHLQPDEFGKVYGAWDELSGDDDGADRDAAALRHLLDSRTDLTPAQREALTGLLQASPVPLDVFDDDGDDPVTEEAP